MLCFAAAVAVTALALTLSAYFITRTAQERDAVDKAVAQTRFNLFLADSLLPADPTAADYDRLLDAYAIRGDFSTSDRWPAASTYVSGPQVTVRPGHRRTGRQGGRGPDRLPDDRRWPACLRSP